MAAKEKSPDAASTDWDCEGSNMTKTFKATCPYCGTRVYLELWGEGYKEQKETKSGGYNVAAGFCPNCDEFIVIVEHGEKYEETQSDDEAYEIDSTKIVFPKFATGRTLEDGIPEKYSKNFREAEQVLEISPKASATLSRYLLQLILHEELHIKKKNLEEELNELATQKIVSVNLAKMLQVFRKVANFGAHPKKSSNSNEIIEVEKGEAEIILDLLEELFDCIFVKPKQQTDFLADIKDRYGIEV